MPALSLKIRSWMMRSFCGQVSLVSSLWGRVASEVCDFTYRYSYLSHPLFPGLADTRKTVFVPGVKVVTVAGVFNDRSLPEIGDSVVVSLTVDMVNSGIRPFPVYIEPSKAVRKVAFPVYLNSDVP